MKEYSKLRIAEVVAEIAVISAFIAAFVAACLNVAYVRFIVVFGILSMICSVICLIAINFSKIQKFFVMAEVYFYGKICKSNRFKTERTTRCRDIRMRFSNDSEFLTYMSDKYDEFMKAELLK